MSGYRKIFTAGRPMKMAITAGKFPLAVLAVGITLILAGCGLTQKVTDGTVDVTKSIFYKQIKTLHLDIRAREAVNSNAGGIALSTVVRVSGVAEIHSDHLASSFAPPPRTRK